LTRARLAVAVAVAAAVLLLAAAASWWVCRLRVTLSGLSLSLFGRT
jgi:hypothetical protein